MNLPSHLNIESRAFAMAFTCAMWPSVELGERINFSRSVPTITPIAKARDVKTEACAETLETGTSLLNSFQPKRRINYDHLLKPIDLDTDRNASHMPNAGPDSYD